MKKITLLMLLSGIMLFNTYGQQRDTLYKKSAPDNWLYIAIYTDSSNPILVRKLFFNDKDIQSHSFAARPGSLSKYGKLNVMEVHLKPNIKLKNMDDILDEYHVKKTDRALPIMIDTSYNYIYPLNTIMAADHSVKSIDIQVDTKSKQHYLNINTGAKRIKKDLKNYIN